VTGRLLVANRGEVAVRIMAAAADLGLETIAVFSEDDEGALHARRADVAVRLPEHGPRAYLDVGAIVKIAEAHGATLLHPGYGFLAERAALARACTAAGVTFVGPTPEVLETFGDKTRARALADECGVPIVAGSRGPVTLAEAYELHEGLPAGSTMMIKAVAGGGGRGMRIVADRHDLEAAYRHCQAEAQAGFGDGAVYVEQLVDRPRHVEVQVVGDGSRVVTLGDRDCTLQRRNQKIVEICPAPWLDPDLREQLHDAAVRLAMRVGYSSLGTVELLVAPGRLPAGYAFMEVNPRLQVEHTVTEQVFGVDLVAAQIRLALGETLARVGLAEAERIAPRGFALQARVNSEVVGPEGTARPSQGVLTRLDLPTGAGIRVDTAASAGSVVSPRYDPLLAKVVVHTPDATFDRTVRAASRALAELTVEGVGTNLPLLRALLADPRVARGEIDTRFVERNIGQLVVVDPAVSPVDERGAVRSGLAGVVVSVVEAGALVRAGQEVAVVEAMKMEHAIVAPRSGVVVEVLVEVGQVLTDDDVVVVLDETDAPTSGSAPIEPIEDAGVLQALDEVRSRHAALLDAGRPDAVARRHAEGHLTVREKIDLLCVPGTFVEYGGLIVAGQRRRHDLDTLRVRSPADGVVTGIGDVADGTDPSRTRQCALVGYDYTVLAGTQGHQGYRKVTRMLTVAEHLGLPVVLFAEGGGGRAGETDGLNAFGLDTPTFRTLARLSGLVPLIGLVSGRCFAGNALLLGCCDVVMATKASTLGMGGPAMIEGAGLGKVEPDEIGPAPEQADLGVVDVLVDDDAGLLRAARQYLGYFVFDGWREDAPHHDQDALRHVIPSNRRRSYDIRRIIELLCDVGSTLELRPRFGRTIVTAFGRIGGRVIGIVANDPAHRAGAIDSSGADKAARFVSLCDAHAIPVVVLCDTPGIAVGPAAEREATVRHSSRLFLATANATTPIYAVVVRRAFGLGAQAMVAGSVHAPLLTIAWPGAQFGSMGVEGMVTLGYRNELAAIEDPVQRQAYFEEKVAETYDRGSALVAATHFELDDVVDQAETRRWLLTGLRSVAPRAARTEKRRTYIDAW
jgi:acetyl/propionyl-CoA carboxylase alpha subunit